MRKQVFGGENGITDFSFNVMKSISCLHKGLNEKAVTYMKQKKIGIFSFSFYICSTTGYT